MKLAALTLTALLLQLPNSYAARGNEDGLKSATHLGAMPSSTDAMTWKVGQSIVLRNAVEAPIISAYDTRGNRIRPIRTMLFAPGSEMSVIKKFIGDNGEMMVELGLDFDRETDSEGHTLYPQITVEARYLMSGNPQPITTLSLLGIEETLSPLEDAQMAAVSSDEIEITTDVAGRGRGITRRGKIPGHRRKGMTYCYRNVKNYLMKRCGFPVYLPGEAAISAVQTLPIFGFQQISSGFDGFEKMPNCTVCILSGGTHICNDGKPCGDVVVKTIDGKGWQGWKPRATPYLDGRTPVGCFYRQPGLPLPPPGTTATAMSPSPTPNIPTIATPASSPTPQ